MTLEDLGDFVEDLGKKTDLAGNIAKVRSANELAKIRQLLEEQANPELRKARLEREAEKRTQEEAYKKKIAEVNRIDKAFRQHQFEFAKAFPETYGTLLFYFFAPFFILMVSAISQMIWPITLCGLSYLTYRFVKKRRTRSGALDFGLRKEKLSLLMEDFISKCKLFVRVEGKLLDAEALVRNWKQGEVAIGEEFNYGIESYWCKPLFVTTELIDRAKKELRVELRNPDRYNDLIRLIGD
jgi:hypothetical protein